jgi:hypothetical protein
MIRVKLYQLQVIMMTKNMQFEINFHIPDKQAVDAPVEKCVLTKNNEENVNE